MQRPAEPPTGAEAIPDLRRLSDAPMKRAGRQGVAVPGRLPDCVAA